MEDRPRLQRFLSMAGRASRREAERLILAGRVRVNGSAVMQLGTRVGPDDVVELDGEVVRVTPPRWIAFHKPPDVLTTSADPHGGVTVYDVLPPELAELRYVGRLDKPTEGLLLLANEGDVVNAVLHPSSAIEREYLVTVKGLPTAESIVRLIEGVDLDDGPARAKRAELVESTGREATLRLILTEGRKREVRRMMGAVGHSVTRLVRVRFGPVALGDLPRGAWRPLSSEETDALRSAAGRSPFAKGEDDGPQE